MLQEKGKKTSERGRVGIRSPLTQQTLFEFQKQVKTQRSVRLPRTLFDILLGIAKDNTLNNTETCGIIAGKDNCTDFVVTHLVISKQRGTSDSCTAMDENTQSALLWYKLIALQSDGYTLIPARLNFCPVLIYTLMQDIKLCYQKQ